MLRYEELQQLSEDRARQLRATADAERRARPEPRRRDERRRQRHVLAALELLLHPRRAT